MGHGSGHVLISVKLVISEHDQSCEKLFTMALQSRKCEIWVYVRPPQRTTMGTGRAASASLIPDL